MIVDRVLMDVGWDFEAVGHVWPMVAGHHGVIPDDSDLISLSLSRDQGQGSAEWHPAQDALVYAVASALKLDLAECVPLTLPSRL